MENGRFIMVAMETAWRLALICQNRHVDCIFAAQITYYDNLQHNKPTANTQKFKRNKFEVKVRKNMRRGFGELHLKAVRSKFQKNGSS